MRGETLRSPDADQTTPQEEAIADLCDRLARLLRDPHHGLSTWLGFRTQLGEELHDKLGAVLGRSTPS